MLGFCSFLGSCFCPLEGVVIQVFAGGRRTLSAFPSVGLFKALASAQQPLIVSLAKWCLDCNCVLCVPQIYFSQELSSFFPRFLVVFWTLSQWSQPARFWTVLHPLIHSALSVCLIFLPSKRVALLFNQLPCLCIWDLNLTKYNTLYLPFLPFYLLNLPFYVFDA